LKLKVSGYKYRGRPAQNNTSGHHNRHGYIMCGALGVRLLNEKLNDRRIVAERATGVRTIEQLLDAPLDMVTTEAELRGICPGMKGADALLKMVNEVS
jgi:uncharacterized protein YunC (DUF1805 family)